MAIRRMDQQWLMEEFYKIHDVYAFRTPRYVEAGFHPADVKRTTGRIKYPRGVDRQWARTADQEATLAREAEAAGHRQSAAEFYHRAALYYGPAVVSIFKNSPHKLELYERLVHCYEKFTELFDDAPMKRVEIPFEGGKSIPGILQLVPGQEQAPCVIVIPGMDTTKEFFPNPYNNHLLRRGLASLSIDGPGQGESNIRENWLTIDNFERAGTVAIDYLQNCPGVDPNRIGLYGWSMGSYLGSRIAAHDPRLKACVAAMGVYLQKTTIFEHAKPYYKANYMYMSNVHDEDEFDRMAEQMTLEPLVERITCPTLLVMGEYDELCPLEDAERLFEMLHCPKELWVFQDESHGIGGRLSDFFLWMTDWLANALAGDFREGHARRVDFPLR